MSDDHFETEAIPDPHDVVRDVSKELGREDELDTTTMIRPMVLIPMIRD